MFTREDIWWDRIPELRLHFNGGGISMASVVEQVLIERIEELEAVTRV